MTRWRQNGINFVINSEPDSFARMYDSMHGASVCALAMSVENVAATVRRAEKLQIRGFSQPIGPGEMPIPSVVGVGGTLIYFMEAGSESQVWDTDFVPVTGTVANPGRDCWRGARRADDAIRRDVIVAVVLRLPV